MGATLMEILEPSDWQSTYIVATFGQERPCELHKGVNGSVRGIYVTLINPSKTCTRRIEDTIHRASFLSSLELYCWTSTVEPSFFSFIVPRFSSRADLSLGLRDVPCTASIKDTWSFVKWDVREVFKGPSHIPERRGKQVRVDGTLRWKSNVCGPISPILG